MKALAISGAVAASILTSQPPWRPQRRGERLALHSQRNERRYVRPTVKGQVALIDPCIRRIVEVLD